MNFLKLKKLDYTYTKPYKIYHKMSENAKEELKKTQNTQDLKIIPQFFQIKHTAKIKTIAKKHTTKEEQKTP